MTARALRARSLARATLLLAASASSLLSLQTAQAADGRQVFTHRCGMCHREGGTGTFILARRLGKDQSLLEQRTNLAPDYIRYVTRWGLVNMPRISRVEVPDPDLDAIVTYLTSRNPP